MKRLKWLLLINGLLFISGCASTIATNSTSNSSIANNLNGLWTIAESYASGADDAKALPPNRNINFAENMVFDASGRICSNPDYRISEASRAQVFGYRESDMPGATAKTQTIQIFCGTEQPFLSLVELNGGVMLLADGNRWLRLERNLDSPSLELASNDYSPPVTKSKTRSVNQAVLASSNQSAQYHLYLASYRTKDSGLKAWDFLKKSAPDLSNMQPVMVPIQISGRGEFMRMYAAADNEQAFNAICKKLAKLVSECGSAAMRWKD